MQFFNDVLQFRGKIRGIEASHMLDFSNVTEEAIENLGVAKAIICLQDHCARVATTKKLDVSEVVAALPETIDMSAIVNGYNARTDKSAGVSTFEKTKKSVEKMDVDKLTEMKAIIEAALKVAKK